MRIRKLIKVKTNPGIDTLNIPIDTLKLYGFPGTYKTAASLYSIIPGNDSANPQTGESHIQNTNQFPWKNQFILLKELSQPS